MGCFVIAGAAFPPRLSRRPRPRRRRRRGAARAARPRMRRAGRRGRVLRARPRCAPERGGREQQACQREHELRRARCAKPPDCASSSVPSHAPSVDSSAARAGQLGGAIPSSCGCSSEGAASTHRRSRIRRANSTSAQWADQAADLTASRAHDRALRPRRRRRAARAPLPAAPRRLSRACCAPGPSAARRRPAPRAWGPA